MEIVIIVAVVVLAAIAIKFVVLPRLGGTVQSHNVSAWQRIADHPTYKGGQFRLRDLGSSEEKILRLEQVVLHGNYVDLVCKDEAGATRAFGFNGDKVEPVVDRDLVRCTCYLGEVALVPVGHPKIVTHGKVKASAS